MIDPQSRSLEWIEQASGLIPNIADTALVEKAIRALSLLESLVHFDYFLENCQLNGHFA